WAWGNNGSNQLADSVTGNSDAAVKSDGWKFHVAEGVAAGASHSLGIDGGGGVPGADGFHGSGEAWGGNDQQQADPNASSGQPVGITAGFPAIAVAAGYAHSLSLYMGRVTSWGANDKGQAGGFGFATDSPQPRLDVRGPGGDGILSGVKAIAAGESHSLALKADGTVWAWGANGQGQLGTNSRTDMGAPVQVHGLTYDSMLSDIVAIAAGRQFSLALRADGAVFVWG